MPEPAELPERLDAVLRVIYLVFNEGYTASSGAALTRHDLSGEAIRLGRLLVELLPRAGSAGTARADAAARIAARGADVADGELILLDDQDRSLWDRAIRSPKALALVRAALASRAFGPYTIQAAIAAVHAEAPAAGRRRTGPRSSASTTCCCAAIRRRSIELNRAVAVAMRDGPAAGLACDRRDPAIAASCKDYRLAHAARAEFCRRLGRTADARAAFERALALTGRSRSGDFWSGGSPKLGRKPLLSIPATAGTTNAA